MSEISPYTSTLGPLAARTASRDIRRAQKSAALLAAERTAQIDAIESVTDAALLATARISSLEFFLAESLPHATPRLAQVANGGSVAISNTVLKMGR